MEASKSRLFRHIPLETRSGADRRVGVEIEFAGISSEPILEAIQSLYGGTLKKHSVFEFKVTSTTLDDFIVELDAQQLKALGEKVEIPLDSNNEVDALSVEKLSMDLISFAAEQLVPWEIVTAPIPFDRMHELYALEEKLRQAGAKGTRHSIRYAFGVHLNPEVPNTDSSTILNYLRAFFCLYDWISEEEDIDLVRRITPYINHFDSDYIRLVIDPDYQPDEAELIDDYLKANPTRNRSLDLLPLFCHMDEERLRRVVDDSRVKPRPTFHYRLPNCDIDNPDWSLCQPWERWLQVEALANDLPRLEACCEAFRKDMERMTRFLDNKWLEKSREYLI